ncbi:MAG: glycoside hydrolase domain-containing protein, partial [Planctomycetota bacterium]
MAKSLFRTPKLLFVTSAALCLTLGLIGAARAANNPLKWQVRNCGVTDTISVWNYQAGDPFARPKPIEIEGARNGVFSGRLIASSSGAPITNMRGEATALTHTGGDGTIPASAVTVRFAEKAVSSKSWNHPSRFDGLLDEPPKKVDIMRVRHKGNARISPPAAVVPVWVSVDVPADAAPGEYEGGVIVEQDDTGPVKVPVKLTVHDWAIPDPKDFLTRQLAFTSPESVAHYYDLELWSDEHFEHIAKSLEWMAKVGSRQAIADFSVNIRTRGNRQTMVRWIKRDDGTYEYDFKPFDRYLDIVEKTLGTPRPLRLNIWGQLSEKKDEKTGTPELQFVYGCAQYVSLLDPETGEVTKLEQPLPGTDECRAFWTPVVDGILERVKKRGWLDVTGIGDCRYAGLPRKQTVGMAKALWPDGQWCSTQHGKPSRFTAVDGATMPV